MTLLFVSGFATLSKNGFIFLCSCACEVISQLLKVFMSNTKTHTQIIEKENT